MASVQPLAKSLQTVCRAKSPFVSCRSPCSRQSLASGSEPKTLSIQNSSGHGKRTWSSCTEFEGRFISCDHVTALPQKPPRADNIKKGFQPTRTEKSWREPPGAFYHASRLRSSPSTGCASAEPLLRLHVLPVTPARVAPRPILESPVPGWNRHKPAGKTPYDT